MIGSRPALSPARASCAPSGPCGDQQTPALLAGTFAGSSPSYSSSTTQEPDSAVTPAPSAAAGSPGGVDSGCSSLPTCSFPGLCTLPDFVAGVRPEPGKGPPTRPGGSCEKLGGVAIACSLLPWSSPAFLTARLTPAAAGSGGGSGSGGCGSSSGNNGEKSESPFQDTVAYISTAATSSGCAQAISWLHRDPEALRLGRPPTASAAAAVAICKGGSPPGPAARKPPLPSGWHDTSPTAAP
eukprot:SM000002S05714  [mRNA]  locus=s2:1707606:1708580:- [translate_table: standard]